MPPLHHDHVLSNGCIQRCIQMVAFCTIGAPLILSFSLLYLTLDSRMGLNLRPVLLMLEQLKEWVMLDI